MKTLENIEIYDINQKGLVVTVEYGMEGCDVTLQIYVDTLLEYIVEQGMNELYRAVDDTIFVDPAEILADELHMVVQSYLESNHA